MKAKKQATKREKFLDKLAHKTFVEYRKRQLAKRLEKSRKAKQVKPAKPSKPSQAELKAEIKRRFQAANRMARVIQLDVKVRRGLVVPVAFIDDVITFHSDLSDNDKRLLLAACEKILGAASSHIVTEF